MAEGSARRRVDVVRLADDLNWFALHFGRKLCAVHEVVVARLAEREALLKHLDVRNVLRYTNARHGRLAQARLRAEVTGLHLGINGQNRHPLSLVSLPILNWRVRIHFMTATDDALQLDVDRLLVLRRVHSCSYERASATVLRLDDSSDVAVDGAVNCRGAR